MIDKKIIITVNVIDGLYKRNIYLLKAESYISFSITVYTCDIAAESIDDALSLGV